MQSYHVKAVTGMRIFHAGLFHYVSRYSKVSSTNKASHVRKMGPVFFVPITIHEKLSSQRILRQWSVGENEHASIPLTRQ
jgi:hypothetical protein